MKNCGLKLKTNNRDNFDEKYMKIKFNSDDDLPLKKALQLCNVIVVVRSVFLMTTNAIHKFFLMNVDINYKLRIFI